ncbi:hypothetical protein TNCV_229471 [Trichonephila clavipes]|nr:hypothetical protein TNCV_229471 [Trichonephila clavipes]
MHRDEPVPWRMVGLQPWKRALEKHVQRSHEKALANGMPSDDKPVPIELSIATIPRDGSDPEIMCITVNHAGQTSKSNDFRSNCQENARLRLVHHPLPKSVPVEYLPFCVRGKFSQLARGNRGLMVVKGGEQQKFFPRARTVCHGPGEPAEIQRHLRWNLSQPRA